jgi:hypothetical protein
MGSYSGDLSVDDLDSCILTFGVQEEMDLTAYNLLDLDKRAPKAHPSLEGEWTGHAFYNDLGGSQGLMQIFIMTAAADGTFRGHGCDYHGAFDVCGRMGENKSDLEMNFVREEMGPLDGGNIPVTCKASLDITRESVVGLWGTDRDQSKGEINLLRIPASAHRFRYSPKAFEESQARARWSFAVGAVLYNVRRRLWSWRFFKARFAERRRFIELYYCWHFADNYDGLNEAEQAELKDLERNLAPADTHFYRSISRSQFKSSLHMLVTHSQLLPCCRC